MEIVLIRHTPTAAHAGTCYGQLDVPLAPGFENDIAVTLARVARTDAVFSSPAQRCVPLARALAARDTSPLTLAPAIQELNFGAWEGLPWTEVPRALSDPWAEDPWNRAPPDGETAAALWQRVNAWRLQALEGQRGRVAIVGHAGSLRALRCLLLGLSAQDGWSWRPDYGSVHVVAPHLAPGS